MTDTARSMIQKIAETNLSEDPSAGWAMARYAVISTLCDLAKEARNNGRKTITLSELSDLIDRVNREPDPSTPKT